MTAVQTTAFEEFLGKYMDAAWQQVLAEVRPMIHEVDRNATEIWFRFYPLALHELLAASNDPDQTAKRLLLEGNYKIEQQLNTSHRFLYGHRFWAEAKRVVQTHARATTPTQPESSVAALVEIIRKLSREVAAAVKQDASLTLGITAVAVMSLRQVGLDKFSIASTEIMLDRAQAKKTPDQILRERARDDSQGLFGFLKTEDKKWTVTFDETAPDGKFKCVHAEEIASGAARDTRDWRAVDPRCIEGPIPVQCRAAACGTCWVGILAGAEKLSPVNRLERKSMNEFGYINTEDERPLIRLACMAQTTGAVSVVIPPWNGIFGRGLNQKAEGREVTGRQVTGSQVKGKEVAGQ